MKYSNLKITTYMTTLVLTATFSLGTLTGCQAKDETQYLKSSNMMELADLSGTDNLLFKYNSFLRKVGSDKVLTEKDLQIIESLINPYDEKIITIQLNNYKTSQVGTDYIITENEENEIELRLDCRANRDLFTATDLKELSYNVVDSLSDYIRKNRIEPIGYTSQKNPAWSDSEKKFILENYGEEVLQCFITNGFPLLLYDVNDFYDSYNKNQVMEKKI